MKIRIFVLAASLFSHPAPIASLSPVDMLEFNNIYNRMARHFWGCEPDTIKLADCRQTIGTVDQAAWRKARPLAARIWQLHE